MSTNDAATAATRAGGFTVVDKTTLAMGCVAAVDGMALAMG
jgi:hypothetical protein